jgi:hypothetical protein
MPLIRHFRDAILSDKVSTEIEFSRLKNAMTATVAGGDRHGA